MMNDASVRSRSMKELTEFARLLRRAPKENRIFNSTKISLRDISLCPMFHAL